MTTTHDDNTKTWRDLTDQLKPDQVAQLEDMQSGWAARPLASGFTRPEDVARQASTATSAARDHGRFGGPTRYRRVMTSWPPITRDDLKTAASLAGFDTVFPILIRRLIEETADELTHLDMPGGSGTASGGFDGVVIATGHTAFVPSGTSVWELSVGGGQGKAEYDFSRRNEPPDGHDMSDVTYIEAILVPWTKARAWETGRSAENRWREVRGYNLDRIHAWLDAAPATTVWLASTLGKNPTGVQNLQHWWTNTWLASTAIPLDRAVVLAGREKAADDLVTQLASGKQVVTLSGDLRPNDARAFVAAVFDPAKTADTNFAGERILFVSDPNSLAQLVAQKQPLILVLANPSLAQELPQDHPHQLIMTASPGGQGAVAVPRLNREVVTAQLVSRGVDLERASRLGTLAHRSLLALHRVLAHNPAVSTPSWAAQPDSVRRRLLLVASWDGRSTRDRQVIADLMGRPYNELQDRLPELAGGVDIPFMGCVNGIWHVLSIEDAWTLLAPTLTSDDLKAFHNSVIEVLSEPDPTLALATGDRWAAGLQSIERKISSTIRTGLAQSLALLSAVNPDVGDRGQTGREFAEYVVRDLLAHANADTTNQFWLSLVDVLSLLAEAAPEQFLDAMKLAFSRETPLQEVLFSRSTPDSFGTIPDFHYFIAALETLAWSPEHLDDAVKLIAALTAADPSEGGPGRRPLTSLIEVLSAWCPNTAADVDDRILAIRQVVRRYPAVGSRLLTALIPDSRDLQQVHPGPRFRDWRRTGPVTQDEIEKVVDAVANLLIDELKSDTAPYMRLIDSLRSLSAPHRSRLAEKLASLAQDESSSASRQQIFEKLREEIACHREYSDTAWALNEQELQPLVAACDALTPQDPVRRHAWLFRSWVVELGDSSSRGNLEEYERQVQARRDAALAEIIAAGGLSSVIELARETNNPALVGSALADHSDSFDEKITLGLGDVDSVVSGISRAYVRRRLFTSNDSLLDSFLSFTQDPQIRARILGSAADPAATWSRLQSDEPVVAEHYWREFVYVGLGHRLSHALEAAWSLCDAGRPAAALDLLMLYERQNDTDEAAEMVAAALEMLLEGGMQDPELHLLSRRTFEDLFALLARHREKIGRRRVVNLEWNLFPMLGFDAHMPTLHEFMVEAPEFFVELVSHAFRPDSSTEEDPQEPTEAERRRALARRAYEVLSTLHLCPGVGQDNVLDEAALRQWVDATRTKLREINRASVGDRQIGEVLANAPRAEDGSRINEAIRDILEDLDSDDIDRGVELAMYRERGFTWRGAVEGGTQERDLAQDFRTQSEAAKASPRTRKLLKRIAETYERQARRNDQDAERRHHGLEW
jgi:hypothetical protein